MNEYDNFRNSFVICVYGFWLDLFSALYWYRYIYCRVHLYIWVVWGLLRSFHVILLVLIKSGWLEFFWKALYFDFYEVHLIKKHIQKNETVSEPIYKKKRERKLLYIHAIIERKKSVHKTVHVILLSFTSELNILLIQNYIQSVSIKRSFYLHFLKRIKSKKWKNVWIFEVKMCEVKREKRLYTSYAESY